MINTVSSAETVATTATTATWGATAKQKEKGKEKGKEKAKEMGKGKEDASGRAKGLSDLPHELAALVFGWLHPKAAVPLRLLSRGFDSLLSSAHFARANIARFVQHPLQSKTRVFRSLESEFDRLYFKLSADNVYAMEYARVYLAPFAALDFGFEVSSRGVNNDEPRRFNVRRFDGKGHLSNLEAAIPKSIALLAKNLVHLNLDDCAILGCIPPEICKLENLEYLSLADNSITGPIPNDIGYLKKLEYLYLGGNMLTGSIPDSIGKLLQLETLILRVNELSGQIPSSFGNLVSLVILDLHSNRLSGALPTEI
ncbi:hypothetical protein HK100_002597, partial [Physocladia obscura]